MVGDRPDSALYVKNKHAACMKAGIRSDNYCFHASVAPHLVLEQLQRLNADPAIDGILLQVQPTPLHLLILSH